MTTGEKQIRGLFRDRLASRGGEHYGYYGVACSNTGQFDAGLCWKCKIKELEKTVAEYQKDYCPMGCIFGLNTIGKLHLYGDCRAPESEHCKANLKTLIKRGF